MAPFTFMIKGAQLSRHTAILGAEISGLDDKPWS